MSNNKKALKSGVWYTAANFLMKSLAFITTPIFTRMLSKEQYGAFQNFASWQGIFAVFVTLNLGTTLISARYDFKKDLDRYITSMLALGGMFCHWILFDMQFVWDIFYRFACAQTAIH